MCWGFSSKATFARGVKWNYSHQLTKSAALHWAVYAELLRRGGHRKARRAVEVKDIDGRVKQLRESNAVEMGEKINANGRTGEITTPFVSDIEASGGDAEKVPYFDEQCQLSEPESMVTITKVSEGESDVIASQQSPEECHFARSNRWAKDHPTDIDEIDLTGKESGFRILLTADQEWMHESTEPGELKCALSNLSDRQNANIGLAECKATCHGPVLSAVYEKLDRPKFG